MNIVEKLKSDKGQDVAENEPFKEQCDRLYFRSKILSTDIYEVYQVEDDYVNAQNIYLNISNEKTHKYLELPVGEVNLHSSLGTLKGFHFNKKDCFALSELTFVNEKALNFKNLLNIFKKILTSLKYVHESLKMKHGNLTDENILFYIKKENKLEAWSLLTHDFVQPTLYSVKITNLSPNQEYISLPFEAPESLVNMLSSVFSPEKDFSADIWALGIIFYQIITTGKHYVTCAHIDVASESEGNDLSFQLDPLNSYDSFLQWNHLYNMSKLCNLDHLENYQALITKRRYNLLQFREKEALEHIMKNQGNINFLEEVQKLVSFVCQKMLNPNPYQRPDVNLIITFVNSLNDE